VVPGSILLRRTKVAVILALYYLLVIGLSDAKWHVLNQIELFIFL